MDFKKLKNILVSNKHGDTPVHPSSHWFSPDLISSFVLSLTDEILQQFVVMTNLHGKRAVKEWRDMDTEEFRAYVGLFVLAGVYR